MLLKEILLQHTALHTYGQIHFLYTAFIYINHNLSPTKSFILSIRKWAYLVIYIILYPAYVDKVQPPN